jgi:hypothetical protein
MHMCTISKEPGLGRVCGLLGEENFIGSGSEGLTLALREIVEHFQITWEVTPHHNSDSGERVENGSVLELRGTHEPAARHTGRTCIHCANLMLGLRIIGDWLFPPGGKCSFCEVQAYSNFVPGDQHGQREARSTRTLRLASQIGTRCSLGACHIWCMTKTKERLSEIGAIERERK